MAFHRRTPSYLSTLMVSVAVSSLPLQAQQSLSRDLSTSQWQVAEDVPATVDPNDPNWKKRKRNGGPPNQQGGAGADGKPQAPNPTGTNLPTKPPAPQKSVAPKPVAPPPKAAAPVIKPTAPPPKAAAPVAKPAPPPVVKKVVPTPPVAQPAPQKFPLETVRPHTLPPPKPAVVAPKPPTPPPAVVAKPALPQVRSLQDVQAHRVQKTEAGGKRLVITEPDKRVIIKQNNQVIIRHDEQAAFQRAAPNAVVRRGRLGGKMTVVDRPGGAQVISETDRKGNLIRRYRRDGNGNEQIIIDNRKRDKFGRNLAIGLGIGAGVIAGAAILNEVTNVPPPRIDIPREKYIVRYEDASEEDVYEAFNAPPVDSLERRYSLDEVRASPYLRDRMRRVDLDDINFETGSWEVDPSEYRKLERVARAMMRVIERNDNEVFLIEGYTDAVGSPDDNLTLSDRRAEAVAEVLTREFNVPPENLTTQGYGEQYLKIDTIAAERANRRVAVRRITPLISQDEPAPPRRWNRDDDDGDRSRDRDYYEDRDRYRNRY